ncbi:serine O-acetyltransferase [Romboutsia timonensis]|uniref:serine O-acetyltransferase n=1 Tax=Romboutsia timonensis TaxID=1776391 RepID=UPI002A7F51BB|nr:serine O-acetyltransferase [Romboutsia timonensis]MDY3959628.1 serine O-acetyltransferase [Romboutsia timonensis]
MSDFRYFKENSPSKSYGAVLLNPCFYAVLLYRISNKLYKNNLAILAKLVWLLNRIVFCVDIDYRATIGENFMLIHGIGVVIGCDVKLGNNIKIYQGVTLGGNGKTRNEDGIVYTQPVIGDNCIIYTNACLFGPIVIKPNTVIKACQVVSKDIV